MSNSYWNYEDDEKIICPYCGKEYEPTYEDTYIGGKSVDCFTEDLQTCTCDNCNKKFTLQPYQAGWNYKTETIDGEATDEENEATAKEGSHEALESIQTEISDLQHHLQNLQDNLGNTYYKMLQECMIEASDNTQKIHTQKSEMLSLYHLLESDYAKRMTWVKNKLPWYMSAFHKLSSSEIFLYQTNIFIGVSFGKQIETKCYVRIIPKDIGWKNCEGRIGVDT
jgi:hypothetical protein